MKHPISYSVRTSRAPGEAVDTMVPVITDRVPATSLADIVEGCIDRGLIVGMKPNAAEGIADGICAQLAHEFTRGRGVLFGSYFYGRPYLDGTTDANGRLTSANSVNVRLYKGSAFRLALGDFTFTFDGSGDAPRIDFVCSEVDGKRGTVARNSGVKVNGRFLYSAGDTVKVLFAEAGGTGDPVAVDGFTAISDELLTFMCPAALVAGRAYGVWVERTDANGVTRRTAEKTVTVTAGEPVGIPSITNAKSTGCADRTVNIGGGDLIVEGENLATATEVKFLDPNGSEFYTVPVTYAGGRLVAAEGTVRTEGPASGSVQVTTAGGTATLDVTFTTP